MDYKAIKEKGYFNINDREYKLHKCNFVNSRKIFDNISLLEQFGQGKSVTENKAFLDTENLVFKHITCDDMKVDYEHFEMYPQDYIEALITGAMAIVSPFFPESTN